MNTLAQGTFPTPQTVSDSGLQPWLVMKFGGSSVSSARKWSTIRDLLRERVAAGYRPLVVHSALAGVSNRLSGVLQQAVSGIHEPHQEEILEQHFQFSKELGVDGRELLQGETAALRQLLAGIHLLGEVSPRTQARVLALGELMATRIGAAYLRTQDVSSTWVDARQLLESVEVPNASEAARYLSAHCPFEPDPELQSQLSGGSEAVITQGFIARNALGESVVLGRGGSDTSAAYLAAKLQALGLEIWTDVPGIFSADPRIVPGARLLRMLSYQEAQEIASTGGSVLHPRCIEPAGRHQIPLRVRCTDEPELPGTMIAGHLAADAPGVRVISRRTRITLISMETLGMWHQVGFLANAFGCFRDLGLSVDLVSTSESNVTVTLDRGAHSVDGATLSRLRSSLEGLCRVQILEEAEVVSLVGRRIRATLHEIGPAMEVFEKHRIHLVSQAANDLNLSFVIEQDQSHRLVQQLHATLVRPTADGGVFGPTWEELQRGARVPVPCEEPWWSRKRSQLLEITRRVPSAYVYDLTTVGDAIDRLLSLEAIDRIFFAVKANSHAGVLRLIHNAGLNFECVSIGEIKHILKLFPEIERDRILFTPNFAARSEYEYALGQGVWLTLDSLHPLRHWSKIFANREVLLRLDIGKGQGHHEHVRTAGIHTKFGIPLSELPEARERAEASGAVVIGLHAHAGSGIMQADHWRGVAGALLQLVGEFPEVRYLNLGGGLGVPEISGEQALELNVFNDSLAEIRQSWPDYELWLEPGRYLVAEAGVLLSQVTQVKGKGRACYVGLDTGMNSFIRPALYGAYHEIRNLSRLSEPASMVASVVGPICETGDLIGSDRLLPPCQEGDTLLIANAGAYGRVMSSHYNLREPAREFVVT